MIKIDKNIRKVFRNGSKYITISIVGSIINIVMMKYYTNIFSKAEYGIMSFYLSFFYFMLPFISLGIDSSFERIYYDYKDEKEKRNFFLSSMIILMIVINMVVFIIGLLIAPVVNPYLSGSITLYITVLIATIMCSWENFCSKINVVEQNASLFFNSKIFYYIVGNGVSVLFILFVFKNIEARFIGLIIGYIASILFSIYFYKNKKFVDIKLKYFSKTVVLEVIKYSLPILVTVILTTSFSYVDKIFIRVYSDFSNMADYSVGQNIGKIMSLFIESFTMAITPTIINGLKVDYQNSIEKIKRVNKFYISGLVIVGILAILFRKPIILILSSKEYVNSSGVFVFIIMAYIGAGAYKIPSIVLMYHKRVKILPMLGMINLIANVGFNQLFVRKFGIVGVAFASYLSMLIYSMFTYLFASKYMYSKNRIVLFFSIIFIVSISLFIKNI